MTIAQPSSGRPPRPLRPRKLYYGWVVVAVAFVTMGVAITARTGFSLLLPEVIAEFGWSSGLSSGAFSVGFLASTAFLPAVGWMMGRWGPRGAIPVGAGMVSLGFFATIFITNPLELYLAFGLLAVNGSMAMSYISHSMFLPNWFVKNRGLAIGLAFAGVGVASVVLLPAMQWLIETEGWRAACIAVGVITAVVVIPLNLAFQRMRPEDMGLLPDGEEAPEPGGPARAPVDPVVDRAWAETEWTLALALRTYRFWCVAGAYFCSLFIWYAIQVHQTRFLIDAGFEPSLAALALGMGAFFGIGGQIGVGALSDRWGREVGWTVSGVGFFIASATLLVLDQAASVGLLWLMVVAQGLLGNGMSAIFGAIPTEIFQGKRFPAIFTAISLLGNCGVAAGAWVMGVLRDQTGSYAPGFWICLVLSCVTVACMWIASPRKVRLVSRAAERRAARLDPGRAA